MIPAAAPAAYCGPRIVGGADARPSALAVYGSALTSWVKGGVGLTGSPVTSWDDAALGSAWTNQAAGNPAAATEDGVAVPDFTLYGLVHTALWSAVSTATAWEIFAVCEFDSAAADGAYSGADGILTESIGGRGLIVNTSGVRAYAYDGVARVTGYVSVPLDGSRRLVGARLDGGAVYASVGLTDSAGVACGSELLRTNALRMGTRYDATNAMDGRILELAIVSTIDATKRATLRRSLAHAWGVSL